MSTQGINQSTFEKVQEISCSKPAIGTSVIVALAIAIIGSLALTGILYPHTPFAALGTAIGQTGAVAMLSSGGTAAFLILILNMCSSKRTLVEHSSIGNYEPNQGEITIGRDTGASGVPGIVDSSKTQFVPVPDFQII